MCRFAAYLGHPIALDTLLYRSEHSIVDQSMQPKEGPLNGDGFGVGWYVPEMGPTPALYRNVAPAWADENMKHIAPRVRTNLFFAHVRGASPGMPVQETNCHPFVQDRLLFMHNGHIKGHDEILRPLRRTLPDRVYFNIRGTTDSEHLFAVVQDELGPDAKDPGARELADALKSAIHRVEALKDTHGVGQEPTRANVALTDGRCLVAMRYAARDDKKASSLYLYRAGRFACENGHTRMVDPDRGEAFLVSSDPMLDEDEGVDPIPENHLVIVSPDEKTRIEPVSAV